MTIAKVVETFIVGLVEELSILMNNRTSPMIDEESLFRLAQDNFEKFYEGHETREAKIAIEAVRNFHEIFQTYLDLARRKDKSNEETNHGER